MDARALADAVFISTVDVAQAVLDCETQTVIEMRDVPVIDRDTRLVSEDDDVTDDDMVADRVGSTLRVTAVVTETVEVAEFEREAIKIVDEDDIVGITEPFCVKLVLTEAVFFEDLVALLDTDADDDIEGERLDMPDNVTVDLIVLEKVETAD